jgi:cell division protein FtsW
MLVVMKFNYLRIKDLAIPLMLFTLLCLILVMTPLGIDS